MNVSFKSGKAIIPVGVSEFSVSGLSLPFPPANIIVQLRQPAADAPIVDAVITGECDENGFMVAFTATIEREGYVLDWTAFSDESIAPVVDTDTLAVSYNNLQSAIANYLGWDLSAITPFQRARIDDCIQSGVRQFYNPPAVEGADPNHVWSFLDLEGSIKTRAGQDRYILPSGIGAIAGSITCVEAKSQVVVTTADNLVKLSRKGYAGGKPLVAAVFAKAAFTGKGQAKELVLFPVPDKEYTLFFKASGDTGKLDPELKPLPMGGVEHAELIIESCLAIAEQRINDTRDIHTLAFERMLVAAQARDQRNRAHSFGQIGDQSATDWDL